MRWALRILGALNILASILSLSYFAWLIEIHLGHWPGDPDRREWIVFLALSAVSVSLVVYQAYLGVRLIKRDMNALGLASLVFVLEIALCFVVTWIQPHAGTRSNIVWFWGIAMSPLQFQVFCGYALVGLIAAVVLILIGRKSSSGIATQLG